MDDARVSRTTRVVYDLHHILLNTVKRDFLCSRIPKGMDEEESKWNSESTPDDWTAVDVVEILNTNPECVRIEPLKIAVVPQSEMP